ncbi:MAG: urease accessory protein UreE [Pseudomonadota bacterium]
MPERLTARSVLPPDQVEAAPDGVVVLPYTERHLRRKLIRTAQKEDVLVDLPAPVSLNEGDRLVLVDGRTLEVRAMEEAVAVVRAGSASLPELAWHIGNRHTPCDVSDDCLLIQRDHVLEDMLQGLGAEVEHVLRPFQPLGGAYGHGRTHGHSHSHDPHEDPNAHIPHRHD